MKSLTQEINGMIGFNSNSRITAVEDVLREDLSSFISRERNILLRDMERTPSLQFAKGLSHHDRIIMEKFYANQKKEAMNIRLHTSDMDVRGRLDKPWRQKAMLKMVHLTVILKKMKFLYSKECWRLIFTMSVTAMPLRKH